MNQITEILDEIISRKFSQTLKSQGFTKKNKTWSKVKDDMTLFVNIQSSDWNTSSKGQFTLNLSVYFPKSEMLKNGSTLDHKPRFNDSVVQTRIGRLMPEKIDLWWDIDEKTNLDEISTDLNKLWLTYAYPWLEEISNYKKASEWLFVFRKYYFLASVFALASNDIEKSKEYLLFAIEDMKNNDRPDILKQYYDWGFKNKLLEK